MTLKDENHDLAVINQKLQHIDEAISGMNQNVKIILEKLNKQNGDLIKAQTELGYLKAEISENKKESKEQSDILWKELRRRDKVSMWKMGVIATVLVGFAAMIVPILIAYFSK